jgi:hypothetical protein
MLIVPNRPTRPGKHVARHKAPTAFSRATSRLASTGGRRTSGTVIALGAVVLAGAAGNGATTAYVSSAASSRHTNAEAAPPRPTTAVAAERAAAVGDVSRSQAREPLTQAVAERRDHSAVSDASSTAGTASHTARAASIVPDDPRAIAESMLGDYGWSSSEMSCLDDLWVSESGWDVHATNPTSGAYGIPQALPAGKMASAGSDWRTNPATQIEWGLNYIESSYGTPCSAWEFKQANDWY